VCTGFVAQNSSQVRPEGTRRRSGPRHPLRRKGALFCRCRSDTMGKKERAKRFAEVKRMLNPKDAKVDKKKHQTKKRDDEPELKHM